MEGRVGVMGRRRRRRKQLLDGLEETRGCWKLKEEALERIEWRTCPVRCCGHCVIHNLSNNSVNYFGLLQIISRRWKLVLQMSNIPCVKAPGYLRIPALAVGSIFITV